MAETRRPSLNVVKEMADVAAQEANIGLLAGDAQVEQFFLDAHIPLDGRAAGVAVNHGGIEVETHVGRIDAHANLCIAHRRFVEAEGRNVKVARDGHAAF